MSRLSRWFIRTALVYLLLALVAGVWQAAPARLAGISWPSYVHLLTLGWLTQLIFGVAHWMFPRPPTASRRGEVLGWTTYWLLNVGLVLRVAGESFPALGHTRAPLLAVSAALQLATGLLFVVNTWPRVRGR